MRLSDFVILNKSLAAVARSMNILQAVEDVEQKVPQIRLKENPYVLTEKSKRCMAAVTAHDLNQYKRHIYTIGLQENVTSWLDELLRAGKEVEGCYEIPRNRTGR